MTDRIGDKAGLNTLIALLLPHASRQMLPRNKPFYKCSATAEDETTALNDSIETTVLA